MAWRTHCDLPCCLMWLVMRLKLIENYIVFLRWQGKINILICKKFFFFFIFLSIFIIIYKDNNKDDTTGSKLIVIYPVAITQRGASKRYVPSQGWVREQGKGVKLGKKLPSIYDLILKVSLLERRPDSLATGDLTLILRTDNRAPSLVLYLCEILWKSFGISVNSTMPLCSFMQIWFSAYRPF